VGHLKRGGGLRQKGREAEKEGWQGHGCLRTLQKKPPRVEAMTPVGGQSREKKKIAIEEKVYHNGVKTCEIIPEKEASG